MSANGVTANGTPHSSSGAPTEAKDAVLVRSDPVPESVRKVEGIEFDRHANHDITVTELVQGMTNMGFQASAIGDAVRIINDMVSIPSDSAPSSTLTVDSARGETARQEIRLPFFSATRLT